MQNSKMKVKVIDKKIQTMFENNPMVLATIDNKKPYAIVVSGVKIKDNKIVITDNFMRKTIANIKKNANVALVVWDKNFNGCQFLGKCKYHDKGEWLVFVKSLKENKSMSAKGAIVVSIDQIIQSK